MADVVSISSRMPVRKKFVAKLNTDELAQIGHPELVLETALKELRSAAAKVAAIKPGNPGEYDAILEVLVAFRGADWLELSERLADES